MTAHQQHELELLIDKEGLFTVLDTMSTICALKAEHVRENWQDSLTASHWDKASEVINKAALRVNPALGGGA